MIVEAALKRRASERVAFIDGACGEDEPLRAEAAGLLDFLDHSRHAPHAPSAEHAAAAPPPVSRARGATEPPARDATTEEIRHVPPREAGVDDVTRVLPELPKHNAAHPSAEKPDAPGSAVTSSGMSADSGPPTRPAPYSMAMEGRRIGPYQILHTIGKGGMGSVYAASRADQEYQKTVAIKMVTSGLGSDEMLRRFRTERQLLAGLDHPCIARLMDGGTTEDGIPYLVMEFVEGLPIDAYCRANRLTVRAKLKLFQKVCGAVHFAHQNLVVHRDIKPGNILVSTAGEPKLLDFGIAKLLTAEFSVEEMDLGAGQAQPMTLRYASPEQIRDEPISTASDIYSLGVLLYELLTGRHPFQEALTGRAQIEEAILKATPDPPSAAARRKIADARERGNAGQAPLKSSRQLEGDIDSMVLMALRKEPLQRYPSAEKMSEDINRHLSGLPVGARGDDFRYRTAKFVRRHLVSVTAAVLVLVALIVSTIVSQQYAKTARFERGIAEQRFGDVRKLAHFVLFDFDNAIRSGTTPARKLLVTQALGYLNELARDASGDVSLERELIDGYLKVGDLQGNPTVPNLGDAAGAKVTYLKALHAAESLQKRYPSDLLVRTAVADVNSRLGDLSLSSNPAEALKHYQVTQAVLETIPADYALTGRRLVKALGRIGFMELQLGDTRRALSSYQKSLSFARDMYTAKRGDLTSRRDLAIAYQKMGDVLARNGSLAEGLNNFSEAESMYTEIARQSGELPGRDIAVLLEVEGDALHDAGRDGEAVEPYRRATRTIERLMSEDPKNRQYRADILGLLGRLADALVGAGQQVEGRKVTERILSMLRWSVDSPDAEPNDVFIYSYFLSKTPFKDLRNAATAQYHAEKLVKATQGQDPSDLDLLANAYFAGNRVQSAIETENKALALLPPTQSALRNELERNLAKFRSPAKTKYSQQP